MKKLKSLLKIIIPLAICLAISLSLTVGVAAEEIIESGNDTATDVVEGGNDTATDVDKSGNDTATDVVESGNDTATDAVEGGNDTATNVAENTENEANGEKNDDTSGEISNIFDEIYSLMEENADKIFSVLAFLGTLGVGLTYKSKFIPLLRDALTKLKSSIDAVKEENDKNNLKNGENIKSLSLEVKQIKETLEENSHQLGRIKWEFDGYEELIKQREGMRILLESQIDLLYSIFMSSSLPQYQKDEIGEKIQKMREELSGYEYKEN